MTLINFFWVFPFPLGIVFLCRSLWRKLRPHEGLGPPQTLGVWKHIGTLRFRIVTLPTSAGYLRDRALQESLHRMTAASLEPCVYLSEPALLCLSASGQSLGEKKQAVAASAVRLVSFLCSSALGFTCPMCLVFVLSKCPNCPLDLNRAPLTSHKWKCSQTTKYHEGNVHRKEILHESSIFDLC